jgi:hypothetical protein
LPQHGLPPGTRAVEIEIHHDPYEAFEIEVVGDDGQTLFLGGVETACVELDEPRAYPDESEEGQCDA